MAAQMTAAAKDVSAGTAAGRVRRRPSKSNSRDAKRELLLDESSRTLNRLGVSQTSLAAIAKSVGISRAALYYYVKDQQDLVFQCYVRTCEQLAGLLDAAGSRSQSAIETICSFVDAALDETLPEFASLTDAAYLNESQNSIVVALYKGVRGNLADVISEGMARGEIRPCDARICASIILGLITWVPVALRWPSAADTPKPMLNAIVQEIIRIGIASKRTKPASISRIDLAGFVTITGNAFDSDVRTAARRETLLASASWLFNQKGVDATSLDEVASRIGVTKKVIYHNMGRKEDLVAECYRRAFGMFQYVGQAIEHFEGPRIDALCTSAASLADACIRPEIAPLVPITGHDAWGDSVREELQKSVERLISYQEKLYRVGIAEGSIRKVNIPAVVMMYPGIYEWMPRWVQTLREREIEDSPDEVANFLRLGLSAL